MKYFTDEQIADMREKIRQSYSESEGLLYMAYISKIEMLNKRYDEKGDCKKELLNAIAELEKATERYIHRGRADPNDEDADAFEYENYDFRQNID